MSGNSTVIDADQPLVPEEAAEWLKLDKLGYDVETLRRWAKEGKIEHSHIGGKVVFFHDQLVRFARAGVPDEGGARKLRKIR